MLLFKVGSVNVVNGVKYSAERALDEFEVFVRYNQALPIIRKVTQISQSNISSIVSARNLFNLDSSIRGSVNKKYSKDLRLYSSRGVGFIDYDSVSSNEASIECYKLFMGKVLSGHLGETDENGQVKVIATLIIGQPYDVCTDSYLVIGSFLNNLEVTNCESYFRTRFLRFLLLQSLVSMNISRNNFRFVPLQDFTSNSDIDWSVSIPEIDAQLYHKYGLSDDEISFIEKMIKPM